jgi:hypothetical protein
LLGDGAGYGAADLFVRIEEQDDLTLEEIGFGKHFDGGEGDGDAGFHVEDAGAEEAAFGDAPGHGAEGAKGPDGIEVAEQKEREGEGRFGGRLGSRTEAGFEDVSALALAVEFDAATEGAGPVSGKGHAAVDGGLVHRGGLGFDKSAEELKEGRLFAAGSGEQGAHGNCGS